MQGMGIKIAVESHRRNKPYSMGTLVWQLNDVWPVVSWSSVDSYGTWKAQHYTTRRLYKDVKTFIHNDKSNPDFYNVYVVNDLQKQFTFNVSVSV
jgi:beta-mannosidase